MDFDDILAEHLIFVGCIYVFFIASREMAEDFLV